MSAGQRGDRPWRLGINDPRGPAVRIFATRRADRQHLQHLRRLRAVLHQGRRPLSPHPRSGDRPAGARLPQRDDRRDSAVLADGLSTGVFLLGPDEGMALIERLPDVEGVIVGADNQVLVSSGLREGRDRASADGRTVDAVRTSGFRAQAAYSCRPEVDAAQSLTARA